MKMYVWEDVLTDYTDGLICVLAKSEKQAWEVLYKKDSTAWWVMQGQPKFEEGEGGYGTKAHDNIPKSGYFAPAIRPKIITDPEAFVVWGGG